MRKSFAVIVALVSLSLFGCASASFTQGKPFDTQKVSSIEKGKTTKQDLVAWFGEPFSKSVTGSDGETWIYLYTQGKSTAQSYIVSMNVKTEGTMKKLDVLLKDGVVQNFTFSDGGLPGTMTSSVGK